MTSIPDQLTAIQAQLDVLQKFTTTVSGATTMLSNKLDDIKAEIAALKIPAPIAPSPDLIALNAQISTINQMLTPAAAQETAEISTEIPQSTQGVQ